MADVIAICGWCYCHLLIVIMLADVIANVMAELLPMYNGWCYCQCIMADVIAICGWCYCHLLIVIMLADVIANVMADVIANV